MRGRRILLKVIYWLAVLVISIVILIVMIMLIESRDQSATRNGQAAPAQRPA